MPVFRWVWFNLIAVAAYLLLGRLCIALGTIGGTASPFWLPAGLITALSLRLGWRILPGIFFGEFLLGVFFMPGPEWKHLMISTGNVLEGAAVILLAPRLMAGTALFSSSRNLAGFFTAAAVGSACNGVLGVTSLWLAGLVPLAAFGEVLLNWSVGDLGGTLIVAPLILAFASTRQPWAATRVGECALLLVLTVLLTGYLFSGRSPLPSAPLAFLLLPCLLWGAFRCDTRGTTLLNAVMIGVAIWGTTHGTGPFATDSPTESLILLQLFTSVLIVTTLVVLIVNQDRLRMTQQLRRETDQLERKVDERTHSLLQLNLQLQEEIAERQRAEAALHALNENLERRVLGEAAKNREKDHLLIRQSRLAAMGEMIGNIAHQWRQPLNALGLVVANIKDAYEFGELDGRYLDQMADKARRLIAQMSTTIDDFRNFFRPDRAAVVFSLSETVKSTADLVQTSFTHHNVGIRFENLADVRVSGFPNEFSQVLLNVLNNARDAIQGSGRKDGEVRIAIEVGTGIAQVEVRDNGGGIPTDVLPKIFDPYFTTKAKGTGIGLYMSKMILENMDGEIAARNEGEGAVFTLKLPLAEQA